MRLSFFVFFKKMCVHKRTAAGGRWKETSSEKNMRKKQNVLAKKMLLARRRQLE